ncbi:hypothetical protein PMAYCL1PPCAC_09045, partial [Pristionchus mayeri]
IRIVFILIFLAFCATSSPLQSTDEIPTESKDEIPPKDPSLLTTVSYKDTIAFKDIAVYYVNYIGYQQEFIEAKKKTRYNLHMIKEKIRSLEPVNKEFAEKAFYNEIAHIDSMLHNRWVSVCAETDDFGFGGFIGNSIGYVSEGSPAALKGLQAGDEIVEINSFPIGRRSLENTNISQFRRYSRCIPLRFRHNVECIKKYNVAKENLLEMGVDLPTYSARHFCIRTGEDGLLGITHFGTSIAKVKEGSPSALRGVKRGDQIIAIDGVIVDTLSEANITALFDKGIERGTVSLLVRENPERLKDLERRRTST